MKTEIFKGLEKSEECVPEQHASEEHASEQGLCSRPEDVQNQDCRMLHFSDTLSKNGLESILDTKWAGNTIYYYKEVDSTNTAAKRLAEAGAVHGTAAIADRQLSGKGRRGRSWQSPAGSSVYMTLILKPDMSPANASMLTLVMALSICKACESLYQIQPQIKWPNDVVLNRKKICGILTEMSAEMNHVYYIIIGAGVNVNNEEFLGEEFPEGLSKTATSLKMETGVHVRRAELIKEVLNYFEADYAAFMESEDLTVLQEEYNSRLANKGAEVKVLEPGNSYTGISNGINSKGELLVEKEKGEITAVFAGEVSVRGIYGYV